MLTQIKSLARLELCNIYNLNVFRFTKDKKAKRKSIAMLILWCFLLSILCFYIGGLVYGLILLGLSDIVPAYLFTISSLLIFFFGIFKAEGVFFRKNGYDFLCSLPVTPAAIIISRFFRMYVENLGITLAILLPGCAVFAWLAHPDSFFYLSGTFGLLFLPLAPTTAATLIGVLVTGISSRMKHKSLATSGLTISVILVIILGSSKLSTLESSITLELMKNLSVTVLELLEKIYPPAVWFGTAVIHHNLKKYLMYIGLSISVFIIVIFLICENFHSICRKLYSTTAKHNYQMETLKKNSVLHSLCKREFQHYFSSSIYVTNTIIGPIMGTVLSGMLLFTDVDSITEVIPLSIDIHGLIPFALAGIFCMMTTTAASISMEGKNWWIVKSLPLTTKQILDAKVLMNLLLILPFYVISEVFLIAAFKPGFIDIIWLLLIPALLILFSCIYGITINLHFPVLNWENETAIIKQSTSSVLGGMGGFLLAFLCIVILILFPGSYSNLVKSVICILLLGITIWLYQKNNRTNLQEI